MLRIWICDDETKARDALRLGLEKMLWEESEQIVYEFSTGEGAVRWLKKQFDRGISLVFVTGYTDYVFDGYKVNALDYVVKPAGTKRLLEVLTRMRKKISDDGKRYFFFRNGEGTYRLPYPVISYFYSDKRKVNVVCIREGECFTYSFYGKLDQVETQLSGAFVRVHQRYLVNPRHVIRVGSESLTVEGMDDKGARIVSIPISRAMKEGAAAKLAKAMLEGEEL